MSVWAAGAAAAAAVVELVSVEWRLESRMDKPLVRWTEGAACRLGGSVNEFTLPECWGSEDMLDSMSFTCKPDDIFLVEL